MKKIALATLLGLSSVSAFAVTAQSGILIGGFGGFSFADAPTSSSVSALSNYYVSKQNKNVTLGLDLGYNYALNNNFLLGAELGYVTYGRNYYKTSDKRYYLSSQGLEALVDATYLATNGFNTFVKFGGIRVKQAGDYSLNKYDIKKVLPTAMIGVGYMPIQNLNIALQYQRVFGDTNTNAVTYTHEKPMTQNAITLGLSFTFPL